MYFLSAHYLALPTEVFMVVLRPSKLMAGLHHKFGHEVPKASANNPRKVILLFVLKFYRNGTIKTHDITYEMDGIT
jgi:hypothetical protein